MLTSKENVDFALQTAALKFWFIWHENMSPPDNNIQWHFGFWGQFVNRVGGFHAENAEKFRRTGKMPFFLFVRLILTLVICATIFPH